MYPRGNKIAPSRWCNTCTDALANWSTSVPSLRHAFSSSFASISFVCLYWLQHNNRVQKKTLELPAWTVGIVLSTDRERFHCSALHSQIEQNRVNFYYKVHIRNTVMDLCWNPPLIVQTCASAIAGRGMSECSGFEAAGGRESKIGRTV